VTAFVAFMSFFHYLFALELLGSVIVPKIGQIVGLGRNWRLFEVERLVDGRHEWLEDGCGMVGFSVGKGLLGFPALLS